MQLKPVWPTSAQFARRIPGSEGRPSRAEEEDADTREIEPATVSNSNRPFVRRLTGKRCTATPPRPSIRAR